jgi:two-component system repressor protein LuxO
MLDKKIPVVLLIEDSPTLALVYKDYLKSLKCHVEHRESGQEGLDYINNSSPSLILLDLQLPDMDGMEILKYIQQQQYLCTVIIITSHGSVSLAVDTMNYGAFDFLEKPFDAQRLRVTVQNALERQKLSDEVDFYRSDFQRDRYHDYIGASLAMQAI